MFDDVAFDMSHLIAVFSLTSKRTCEHVGDLNGMSLDQSVLLAAVFTCGQPTLRAVGVVRWKKCIWTQSKLVAVDDHQHVTACCAL